MRYQNILVLKYSQQENAMREALTGLSNLYPHSPNRKLID